MKTYYLVKNDIVDRCVAHDLAHARVKFEARIDAAVLRECLGVTINIVSAQDYADSNRLVREQMSPDKSRKLDQ